MSSSQELYNRLDKKLRELGAVKNRKQVTNWIWIIVGILQSQSVNLSQIANTLPLATQAESRVTLIRRWLTNRHVKVWQFYKKVLEHVLSGWSSVEAYLILDGVMVFGDRWQIFRVSLRHGCRAIPIAWAIVEGNGLVKVQKLKSMLEKVQRFMNRYVKRVTFLADAGFRDCDWAQLCQDLGWNYAIRIACNTYITLLRACDFPVGKSRVTQLMRAGNMRGQRKRKQPRITNSQHCHPVAPNHLNRDFHTTRPNEKWLADITYIPTAQGWLYLAVVLDLFSRKIVGWAFAATLESSLVEQAFHMAVHNPPALTGLLHHSDRGSQYAGDAYQQLLIDQQVQVSMSRTGNCYDNAPMESFFSTLKCEHVHFQNYQTLQDAQTDIFAYIVGFYNRQRRHSSLGYLSPDEFERRYYNNLS